MLAFNQCTTPDELINFLVVQTPQETTDDACSDYLLVEEFFPIIGLRFETECDVYEEDIQRFKDQFPYEKFGLDREQTQKAIDKLRSIRAIVDRLVEQLPHEVKDELARQHLKRIWFEQNAGSDFEVFKRSVNPHYWQLEKAP